MNTRIATQRERLPNRRRGVRDSFTWRERRIHVAAGFSEDGRVLECFLRGGGRVGSDTDQMLDDLAVLVSRGLQHGDKLVDMKKGLGRLPDGTPASVVGAALDALLAIEATQ
jgi:hypothetical protein